LYLLFKKKPKQGQGAGIKEPQPSKSTSTSVMPSESDTDNNVFKSKKGQGLFAKKVKGSEVAKSSSSSFIIAHQDNVSSSNDNNTPGRFFERITGDEEEDEIEAHLTTVSHHLTELKDQAHLMGSTVTCQNEQLDRINTKVENNQVKLSVVTAKTGKLVGEEICGVARGPRTGGVATKPPKKSTRCTIV